MYACVCVHMCIHRRVTYAHVHTHTSVHPVIMVACEGPLKRTGSVALYTSSREMQHKHVQCTVVKSFRFQMSLSISVVLLNKILQRHSANHNHFDDFSINFFFFVELN